jgi:hypothetical protein
MTQIVLGTSSRDELGRALNDGGVRTNAYFDVLWPHVQVAPTATTRHLVVGTAAELGAPVGCTVAELLVWAACEGLGPCPLEVAARLRLMPIDEPTGTRLTVVSARVVEDERFPRGFYLRRDGEGLWLRAFVASDDWVIPVDERLALTRENEASSSVAVQDRRSQ